MTRHLVSFLAGLGIWIAGAPSSSASTVRDPGCDAWPILQRSETVLYPLPRGFLREGSDSLWSASRSFVRGVDYVLERTRGTLRLRVPPVPGETLWVRACGLLEPPPLETRFLSYRPARTAGDSAAADSAGDAPPHPRPSALRTPTEAPAGTALSIHGNKTLAVDFGSSQDAFLRQSLDLSVGGTLAPGVELTGVLSDRNTPLTAAGSTRDLQSLDRLLLELKAPGGGAALGDVTLALDQGEFGRLERRLQGIRGDWGQGDVRGVVAAASAEGEFHSVQFYGVEGRQGPYLLSGKDGGAIAVVPGSDVVTLDGERMVRGEGADYAMDYERATLTFTNRRPIGAASRITVDYQIAVNRFRRNLAAAAARWARGPWRLSTTVLTEGDDRGRPLAPSLNADDRIALASAGDSAAVSSGVTPGGGDYDRSADSTGSRYVYAGPDSGDYAVSFARVGANQGDYVDSATVSGRVAYRYVGPGLGTHRVGRSLPLPDSHQLWSVAGGAQIGALEIALEGALSRRDLNTFSALDDQDNLGRAGTARLALEGRAPWLLGAAGVTASSRIVDRRFAPFTRLERPFAQEDWGLPVGADLERQARHEAAAFLRPGFGGELHGSIGRLETVNGFRSWRRSVQWDRAKTLVTRARWERADGEEGSRAFAEGGRERRTGEIGLHLDWIRPVLRADWDERWSPSDTGRAGDRSRELAAEIASGARFPWRMTAGVAVRRDARRLVGGYRDLHEVRTGRWSLQTPEGTPWGAQVQWQHRVLSPLATRERLVSDLASARLRAADAARGWTAAVGLEITNEAESERLRQVSFVGAGQGAYDSLGNFLGAGHGDYTVLLTVGGSLQRVARAAGSVRLGWQPSLGGTWQGSRAELSLETDARRRGALRGADALLSPGAALEDGDLSRGVVTQRLEAEVLPQASLGTLRLRLERRVSADRSYSNFSQRQDERSGALRISARPGAGWTAEAEGRMKRQAAAQEVFGGAASSRAIREGGVLAQIGWSPSARLRGALVSDLAWTREEGAALPQWAKTWRFGPELGLSVLAHGRIELSARRTLTAGTPVGPVLPIPELLGVPRWESSARFDYRLRDQTTIGFSLRSRERDAHAPEHEGRAEVRAFF